MDRRGFFRRVAKLAAGGVGLRAQQACGYTSFVLPENAFVQGPDPLVFAEPDLSLMEEWQEFTVRTVACAFAIPPSLLAYPEIRAHCKK